MGRVILINSVLDSQLIYIMSATQVPPEVIKQIDKRRRAFLWSGNKETSAAKCLVAWPNVCTTKELGGLGIRDFGTQEYLLAAEPDSQTTLRRLLGMGILDQAASGHSKFAV